MKVNWLPVVLSVLAPLGAVQNNAPTHLEKEVRHELVMLPNVNIFDNLEFRVDGNAVTLMGQVTNPVLKSDAEKTVKRIEGVSQVVNQIEVLPLSPNDNQLRRATYLALVRDPRLQLYFMQALPSIRIIVKNGNITLEGVVSSQADSDTAKVMASAVPGAFSVTSHLRIEK